MLNQEVHKNLRRNKIGVNMDRIEDLPSNYERPAGFTVIPTLLNASMQNKSIDVNIRNLYPKHQQPQNKEKSTKNSSNVKQPSPALFYNHMKNEMSR